MIGKLLSEGNEKLQQLGIEFLDRAAETGNVRKMTREYLDSLLLETRVIDAVPASTEISLFGQTFATPVMPAALSGLNGVCPDGMVEMAKGAKAAGAAMWVGIGETQELKAIIAAGAKAIKIVKPYKDEELLLAKLAEAEQCGAFAVGMDVIFGFGGKVGDSLIRPELMAPKSRAQIEQYVKATKLPFVLKGILSERDAEKSLEAGAAAIVVSHHGGSVLDYAVPPLKILPRIARIVDGKIPIIVDSGLIRGTDVFKALALGADSVLVGRSAIIGLAAGGAGGVQKLIEGTNEELRRVMSLTGCATVAAIQPDIIWA